MKPLSEHLVALIAAAEDIVRQPHEAAVRLKPGFAEVASAIRRAHAMPAEGTRTTHAGVAMLDLIEGFSYAQADASDRWQMLIGSALPLLRTEAWAALGEEKDARLTDQAPGFRR